MSDRLIAVVLDEEGLVPPGSQALQERRVAIHDLVQDSSFALPPREGRRVAGPWRLALGVRDRRLVFAVSTEAGEPAGEFHLSLGPFRQVVKDYDQICESYAAALTTLPAAQVETVDMARRGIHNEGARILQERLEGKAILDTDTARRLFTLICVLRAEA